MKRWVIAIDTGRVVNPLLLTGQIRGAAIQGVGGTFYEEFAYDEDGQPLSASFLGYLLPTAAEAPDIDVVLLELGSVHGDDDRLGAKGGGETGIVGTAAALANAVSDALGRCADERSPHPPARHARGTEHRAPRRPCSAVSLRQRALGSRDVVRRCFVGDHRRVLGVHLVEIDRVRQL